MSSDFDPDEQLAGSGSDGEPGPYPPIPQIGADDLASLAEAGSPAKVAAKEKRHTKSPRPPTAFVLLPGRGVRIEPCAVEIFKGFAKKQLMFLQGAVIVELVPSSKGGYELRPVSTSALRSRLEALGNLVGWRSDKKGDYGYFDVACSEDSAKALLASKAAQEHLKRITNLVSCPVAVLDDAGQLKVCTVGYHPEQGGMFVTRGEAPIPVPLETATTAILELLSDFPFESGADISRAVAALLTPSMALGGLLGSDRSPAILCQANTPQVGKTYFQKLVAAVHGEHLYVVTQRKNGVGSLDESFSSALLSGSPFIQIDNLRGDLDSQQIESFLTAVYFPARVPHREQVEVNTSRFTVMITTNGLKLTEDMLKRCFVITFTAKPHGHDYKRYAEGDLLAKVRQNQPYYLGCIFSILRTWVERERPGTKEDRHTNYMWARSMDWIVQELFGLPPLMDESTSGSAISTQLSALGIEDPFDQKLY